MDDREHFTQQRKKNILRKFEKPGWPTHKEYVIHPGKEPRLLSENVPIERNTGKTYYCKYCYTSHDNWWLMDNDDYNIPGEPNPMTIMLCGECEHTSSEELLERTKHY
jgi:hypothetical protein